MSPAPTLTPLYARRDAEDLCEYYTRHLDAMTREGLHSKSDIAAELAWRDREIAAARNELSNMAGEVASYENECACIPEDFSVPEYVDALKQQAERLAGALKALMALRNNIEVMGEWSALDINATSYRKTEAIVEAAMGTARKELAAWEEGK